MGYNRSYYTHGSRPFAYNWQGRIAQPARGGKELGSFTGALTQTVVRVGGVEVPGWAALLLGGVAAVTIYKKVTKKK